MSQNSQVYRNLHCSTIDGIFATPWTLVSLPASFLMAGLLNSFYEVGPFWFGLICAMPAIMNALQILLIPTLAKFMNVRDLVLGLSWLNAGLWASGLIGIAFLPQEHSASAGIFFALLFLFSAMSGSFIGLGWTTWAADFIPFNIRGRYVGNRNRFINVCTLVYMLFSLALLEKTNASKSAYLILLSIAVFMRIVSILVQYWIVSKTPGGGELCSEHWFKDLGKLTENKPFIRFVVVGTILGFWLAFNGVLTSVYAFDFLKATPSNFTGWSIAATICGVLFLRNWGVLIDRHGAIPVILISFLLWRIMDIGWVVMTPETVNWMYLTWSIGGIAGSGYLLAVFTLLLKLVPKERRAAGISFNLTVTSIAGAIAPILSGYLVSKSDCFGWDLTCTYRMLISVGLLGGALGLLGLLGAKEPESDPNRNNVAGVFRSMRGLVANGGSAFLNNITYFVPRRSFRISWIVVRRFFRRLKRH